MGEYQKVQRFNSAKHPKVSLFTWSSYQWYKLLEPGKLNSNIIMRELSSLWDIWYFLLPAWPVIIEEKLVLQYLSTVVLNIFYTMSPCYQRKKFWDRRVVVTILPLLPASPHPTCSRAPWRLGFPGAGWNFSFETFFNAHFLTKLLFVFEESVQLLKNWLFLRELKIPNPIFCFFAKMFQFWTGLRFCVFQWKVKRKSVFVQIFCWKNLHFLTNSIENKCGSTIISGLHRNLEVKIQHNSHRNNSFETFWGREIWAFILAEPAHPSVINFRLKCVEMV